MLRSVWSSTRPNCSSRSCGRSVELRAVRARVRSALDVDHRGDGRGRPDARTGRPAGRRARRAGRRRPRRGRPAARRAPDSCGREARWSQTLPPRARRSTRALSVTAPDLARPVGQVEGVEPRRARLPGRGQGGTVDRRAVWPARDRGSSTAAPSPRSIWTYSWAGRASSPASGSISSSFSFSSVASRAVSSKRRRGRSARPNAGGDRPGHGRRRRRRPAAAQRRPARPATHSVAVVGVVEVRLDLAGPRFGGRGPATPRRRRSSVADVAASSVGRPAASRAGPRPPSGRRRR